MPTILATTMGFALMLAPITLVCAQSTGLVDISRCAGIESAVARLDCYDALARASAGTVEPALEAPRTRDVAQSGDPRPATSASAPTSRMEPPARDRPTASDRSDSSSESSAELVGTVAALREIQPGRLEITLANGEIWRQTNSDRYRLRVGQEVRIYRTRFGGYYRLSAPELRGFVQVVKVQ